jgi:hypothetical protein
LTHVHSECQPVNQLLLRVATSHSRVLPMLLVGGDDDGAKVIHRSCKIQNTSYKFNTTSLIGWQNSKMQKRSKKDLVTSSE